MTNSDYLSNRIKNAPEFFETLRGISSVWVSVLSAALFVDSTVPRCYNYTERSALNVCKSI